MIKKYPSNAPEIKCDIIADFSMEHISSIISDVIRKYNITYDIDIPIQITESIIIDSAHNVYSPCYSLKTKADSEKYVTPHSIERYTSLTKDIMLEIADKLKIDNIEIIITNCISEKYVYKR